MYPAPRKLSKFARFLWISKSPQYREVTGDFGIVRSIFTDFSNGATYIKKIHGDLNS